MKLNFTGPNFPHRKWKEPINLPFLTGVTIGYHRQLFNSFNKQGTQVGLTLSAFNHDPTGKGPHITHEKSESPGPIQLTSK